jgi:hypothetical protein
VAIRILAGGSVTGHRWAHRTGRTPIAAACVYLGHCRGHEGASLRRVAHYGDAEIHSDACSEAGPAFASWTKPTSGGGHPVIPWPQGTPWPRSQHAAINPPISTFASLTAASASNTRRTLP